ncbi:MaoC family dehydratase [Rhizobium pusense]|jgi:acyl dehydratase|uniref:MaoC family dehydratase n=3 Tax=Hyphomicrobiales TaxID=356 RepID=A0A1L9CQ71_9HYPH|nr:MULTISPECIES: MaoC family dehydratase [Rhizobium/Agrobacterium group]AMD57679.1 Nodulation protein N [Agrobacterium tumefaciens]ANV26360.1 Nodulation protein N [Rhizobium sp. S41]AUC12378.1 Nodulation protein N [Rhizobium sp. Y9]EKJ96333.1 nodulation protein N [Bradyrhizobium lupini HPC(L)]KGE83214.1 Nodulation protein N [Rhizobium sp. H41]KIV65155.1 Acyl dehydratase [Rhizobium sp. UR51a]MBB2908041.1 acyl dehydratase [Rhizobium sp. RAS22]MBM7327400.1 MaoC family dehydratase [Agrobacteriu
MTKEIALAEMKNHVGTEMGVSDWITVDQTMIDSFAKATLDDQFIHTDPERAKAESPFGGTIAHGFLTLSLLSALNYDALPRIREQTMGINYGFDAIRFVAPVKSGARVRGRFTLAETRFRGASMLMTTYDVTVEIENEKKPALTARWTTISQFNPEDRPEDA